ncbi:MAG: hypothetical protein RLO01_04665 [Thalassobaculaceae bacterium]
MRPLRHRLFAAAALAASVFTSSAVLADDQSLVTVVTSPDPQTQLMAMVLTMQAVRQGSTAQILLCGPGGDIALQSAPASATAPQAPKDMSPQGLMKTIMGMAGTSVQVCALYLPNKGVGADALLAGVTVAAPPAMAAELMKDDTRVLSF